MPDHPVKVNSQNLKPLILQLTAQPDVTLSDIAKKAQCTLSFVSACAHGRKRPTKRVRDAAEKLLGHPAEELFPQWPARERA